MHIHIPIHIHIYIYTYIYIIYIYIHMHIHIHIHDETVGTTSSCLGCLNIVICVCSFSSSISSEFGLRVGVGGTHIKDVKVQQVKKDHRGPGRTAMELEDYTETETVPNSKPWIQTWQTLELKLAMAVDLMKQVLQMMLNSLDKNWTRLT